jgi:hypothetical protein
MPCGLVFPQQWFGDLEKNTEGLQPLELENQLGEPRTK